MRLGIGDGMSLSFNPNEILMMIIPATHDNICVNMLPFNNITC